MQENEDLWYRIGFAMETARRKAATASLPRKGILEAGKALQKVREKPEESPGRVPPGPLDGPTRKLLEAVFTVGAGTLLTRFLTLWPGSRRPGLLGLGRAGAAGAAAAFLASRIHPFLATREGDDPPDEDELAEILLSGAGRGLVYAAVVEPRVPGPSILRGSVYGALEWALAPWGGLEELAGPAAPQGKLPLLSVLLRGRAQDDQLLEHLAFGMALALLYRR